MRPPTASSHIPKAPGYPHSLPITLPQIRWPTMALFRNNTSCVLLENICHHHLTRTTIKKSSSPRQPSWTDTERHSHDPVHQTKQKVPVATILVPHTNTLKLEPLSLHGLGFMTCCLRGFGFGNLWHTLGSLSVSNLFLAKLHECPEIQGLTTSTYHHLTFFFSPSLLAVLVVMEILTQWGR